MKSFLAILIIGVLSAFYLTVSFLTFQLKPYSLFQLYWDVNDFFDIVLLSLSWLLSLFISIRYCWKTLKWISPDYNYHFIFWLVLMTLFTYPMVINRGWYWFQFGAFFGLPIIGLHYLATGLKNQWTYNQKKVNYIIISLVFLIGAYGEFQATNSSEITTSEYEFEVNTYTIPTFLDWQVEAEIEIEDLKTGDDYEFDFWFGDGPHFEICKDIKSPTILYLRGYERNSDTWTINLETAEIDNHLTVDKNVKMKTLAVMNGECELVK